MSDIDPDESLTPDLGPRTSDFGPISIRLDVRRLPGANNRIVVAVSGGADSVALWALLAERQQWPLTIWHLDHGLRSESAADAAFVASLAKRLGGDVQCERADIAALSAERGEGLEATGRRERYARLIACARRVGAGTVVTAHHQGDLAETVLFNALRGAGPIGLMGISRRRCLAEAVDGAAAVMLVRPLLGCSRASLRTYLTQRDLPWREDASNNNLAFSRNRIRHRLLPAMEALAPGATAAWAHVAARVRQRTRADRQAARVLWRTAVQATQIDLSAMVSASLNVRRLVWRHLLRHLGAAVERTHLDALDDLALGEVGRRWHGGAWLFLRRADALAWEVAKPAAAPLTIAVAVPGSTMVGRFTLELTSSALPADPRVAADQAWLAPTEIVPPLCVRSPLPGERWQPFGCAGTKPITTTLAEHEVPSRARATTPVLADADGVLWIPGVGIAERMRCTTDLREVWHARWMPASRRA